MRLTSRKSQQNYVTVLVIVLQISITNAQTTEPEKIDCKSTKLVQQYLDRLANKFGKIQRHDDFVYRPMPEDGATEAKKFDEFWQRCHQSMSEKTRLCLSNIKGFLKGTPHRPTEMSGIPTHGIGLDISNKEHYEVGKSRFPEMMEAPKPLLSGMSQDWLDRFEACKKNPSSYTSFCSDVKTWKVVTYQSIDCGVHAPIQIALLYVPGKNFDRWLIYRGIPSSPSETFGPQMISVQKKDPNGSTLAQPIPYWSILDGKGVNHHNAVGCVGCHSGGVNKIRIVPGTLKVGGLEELDSLNNTLASYGRMGLDEFVDFHRRGPPLGTKNCVACHSKESGGVRQMLTDPMRMHQRVLLDKDMPPASFSKARNAHMQNALRKTELLSAAEKKKIQDLYSAQNPDSPQAPLVCDKSKLEAAQKENLRALRFDHKVLSEKEYSAALEELDQNSQRSTEVWKNIEKDLDGTELWLQGGEQRCVSGSGGTSEAAKPANRTDR